MTFSIITPAFNAAGTIQKTIESLASQSRVPDEYLVIDGASTDGTPELVKRLAGSLRLKLVSEPDKGIYDAMNKGIKMTTGEIIGILNADDFWRDNEVLAKVETLFASDGDLEIVYGDIVYIDQANPDKIIRYWRAGDYSLKKLNNGWIMPHPAVFVKKSLYDRAGLFDDSFKLAGDYEIMLRWLLRDKAKAAYLPEVLTVMSTGGASGGSLRQRILGWEELKRAWKRNNLSRPPFFVLRRVIFKLKQFLF